MTPIPIDGSWSLLLDRDGVLNRKVEGGYVTRWEELEFLPNALQGLAALEPFFAHIVVTTNQRCVARRLLADTDHERLHTRMVQRIEASGGRIDAIYYCPHDHADACGCRKPATGLGLSAKRDFPAIDFRRSLVVGDSESDMEFGRRLGAVCVFVGQASAPRQVSHRCSDLLELASLVATR